MCVTSCNDTSIFSDLQERVYEVLAALSILHLPATQSGLDDGLRCGFIVPL